MNGTFLAEQGFEVSLSPKRPSIFTKMRQLSIKRKQSKRKQDMYSLPSLTDSDESGKEIVPNVLVSQNWISIIPFQKLFF